LDSAIVWNTAGSKEHSKGKGTGHRFGRCKTAKGSEEDLSQKNQEKLAAPSGDERNALRRRGVKKPSGEN